MAVGFATLSGGDTVSFNLDPNQISAVQNALHNLSARDADFTVYNPDGGTTVSRAPAHTDAVMLDSINGSTGTSLSGSFSHPALWIGNQGNDTFSIYGQGQTIIAGDGNNTINFTGGGEVSVGGGNNRITTDAVTHSGNVAEDGERSHGQRSSGDDRGGGNHTTPDGNGIGAMTIVAGSGNNSLTLGVGAFDVELGGGNDSVTLDLGRATVSNSGGSTYLDATHGTDLNYTGVGTDTILLGAGSDSVVEMGAATVIGALRVPGDGATPHATVQGGSGNLVFTGHDGNDSVTAGSGATTLTAGNGTDTFHAGASAHALLDVSGASGNDALYGGSGSATLLGGSGRDSFFGGSGNTTMVGGSNWNYFTGGSGNDTMVAHTVPMGHGHGHGHDDEAKGQHGHGVDQNVFNFDAAVGGHHEIDGYNSTAPGGDTAIHLTFTNYGLTPNQIVADSAVVGHNTVITLPGAGGNPTTTITLKDFTGIADWNVNSH
jgi:Ca2+-binding RTX toxin-like protein